MRQVSGLRVKGPFPVQGEIRVPGDKSISHRAVMLLALSRGKATIKGFLASDDCMATVNAFRSMGVDIRFLDGGDVEVRGVGLRGLSEPGDVIDCGNSGTLMRLILGILAGQPLTAFLSGDASLRSRPMSRVIRPLSEMGATVMARRDGSLPPLAIKGGHLSAISFSPDVASAQVKSCVLLAGILADGITQVNELRPTRDHTERMLDYLGARVSNADGSIRVEGGCELVARDIAVPGDISSAAFALCVAAASPGCRLTVKGVGTNERRAGVIRILERMGASIEIQAKWSANNEDFADLVVTGTSLRGVDISRHEIPDIIDEIPILSLIATQCKGTTTIRGAGELRVKESDRLKGIDRMLTSLGAKVAVSGDDIVIEGQSRLMQCRIDSSSDHRLAMSAAMAAAFVDGVVEVADTDCITTSFPEFTHLLRTMAGDDSVESFSLT